MERRRSVLPNLSDVVGGNAAADLADFFFCGQRLSLFFNSIDHRFDTMSRRALNARLGLAPCKTFFKPTRTMPSAKTSLVLVPRHLRCLWLFDPLH